MFNDVLDELFRTHHSNGSQLASHLGISRSAITHWRNRECLPSVEILEGIADYYGVSMDYLLERAEYKATDIIEFEVIGKISAGFDGEAVELKTGEIVQIPKHMLHGRKQDEFFVLEIRGSSMYPKFLPQDKVLCLKTDSVDSGSTACVLYNSSEATIKVVKYGETNEQYMDLIPINPEYETKHITGEDLNQCKILGKVVKLIRDVL